ncbi:MAG: phosphotransferase family protein, partial [Pseudomonadota bacterium]
AKKFETGQSNPTFLLITPKRKYVLRRKPPGELLKSAHAVDREFRVQKALQGSDVPVARMHLLCEDEAVIGSMFYVMDHVDGRNFNDPRLRDLDRDHRIAVFDEMNRVLAALHDIDLEATGLSDFGRPGNYFERQIGRWSKQYKLSETEPLSDMDRLIEALQDGLPDDDGMHGLVHGDYRLDNLIFNHDATRCLAVLDWELSTTGHPFADLAYVIMQWQMPVGDDSRGLEGVDRAELGIPSDETFIARYCERRGLSGIPDFAFYLAFCFFRMAAILQGVKKRALEGNASNPEKALKLGAQVPNFAARGLKALDNG